MNDKEFNYVDFAIGGPQKRNNPALWADACDAIKAQPQVAAYATIHRFDQSFRDYLSERKTVKGFRGPSYTPWLIFDFDDPKITESHRRTQQFVREITDGFGAPKDQVVIYFSGRKGYHVYLPAMFFGDWTPSETLHKKLKTLALRLANSHSPDPSIYDQSRLIRHPGSLHPESNLYKTWIPTGRYLESTAEEIVAEAAIPPSDNWFEGMVPPHECGEVEPLAAIWLDIRNETPRATGEARALPADHQTLKGSFPIDLQEGEGRDNQVYFKARQLRNWGVPAYEANNILQLWDGAMEVPLTTTNGPSVLWDKVKSAYGADADFDAEEGIQVYTGREALNEYQGYLDNPSAQIATGYDELDTMHRHIRVGEVVMLLGKTGSGKTAFALNALSNMAKAGHKTLFFSLEMTLPRVVERQCAIEAGATADEIESNFDGYRELCSEPWWDNYNICAQSSMSLAKIEETIQRTSDYSGKVEVACIDYLGLIRGSAASTSVGSYQAVSEIAVGLKSLSKRCECAIIVLGQIGRAHGEEGDVPISMTSGRDSGAIEEGADLVLGVHRPERGTLDRLMSIQVLKSRKGMIHSAGSCLNYAWHGPSFTVQKGHIDPIAMDPHAPTLIRPKAMADPIITPETNHIVDMFDGEVIADGN